jgi:hypothetical protein
MALATERDGVQSIAGVQRGEAFSAAPDNYFTAALTFSAASGETHLVQVASLFLR